MDAAGRMVMNESIDAKNSKLNVSNLTKGVYTILIDSNNEHTLKPMKFIKL